ncbi:eukaryotic aspartyl protease family protein [Tanacetum coccineum]
MSLDMGDLDLISKVHVRIKAKIIDPNTGMLEEMIANYTKRGDLRPANEVLDLTRPNRLPITPTMLSLMAIAYCGKRDTEKGDNFLQRINHYTSQTYITVQEYKTVDVNHIERILQELHMNKFELTKEIYEAILYGSWTELKEFEKEYEKASYTPNVQNRLCRLVQWLRVNPNNDNTTSTGSSSLNENDDGLLLNVLPLNVFDKGYDIENLTYASSLHVPHAIAVGLEGQHTRTRNTDGT